MSKSNRFCSNTFDDIDDTTSMDFSDLQNASLDDFLHPFKRNHGISSVLSPPSSSSDDGQSNQLDYSNNQNNLYSSTNLSVISQALNERLQMVEQPYHTSKLRYRADYNREKGRLGAIGNRNERSKLKGPAISIPKCYLNSQDKYFIRVSLVTIKSDRTNVHYLHPYELEHPRNEPSNDRTNNSVWFPIESNDSIKNFPFLRIVKKKGFSVQKLDHLRVFDCDGNSSYSEHCLKKDIDIIKEYNMDRSQLAFTLGKKVLNNGQSTMMVYINTTIFSEEINEYNEKYSDNETDTESSGDKTNSSPNTQTIYKYAPKCGTNGNSDETLVFLKKKLETKKYGDLQIIFECDTFKGRWSQRVSNFEVKDRMISFRTPILPFEIIEPVTVDIILRQDNRILGTLKYTYLPAGQSE